MEKNYLGAVKLFDKSTKIKPDFWQAINNQGLAYFELNNVNLAIKLFESAISIEENAEPLLGLASCINIQDNKLAIELAKKALDKDPKYVNYDYRKEQLWGEKLQASTEILLQDEQLKKDVIQSLCEAGINKDDIIIDDRTPSYYHPGKSGGVYQNKKEKNAIAYFGEIHPNIIKKLDIKTEGLVIFEICLDYIKESKQKIKDSKSEYKFSDFQKSERDFAFIINKNFKSQELVNIIKSVDNKLIKSVRVFDVFEGENIPEGKKSIAVNVTIQSEEKTLNENDLENINKLIISSVESKSGAKIRS